MCGIFFFSTRCAEHFKSVNNDLADVKASLSLRGPDHSVVTTGVFGSSRWLSVNEILAIRSDISMPCEAITSFNDGETFLYNGNSYEESVAKDSDTGFFRDMVQKVVLSTMADFMKGSSVLRHSKLEF